jgi:hypothetical protein
MEIVVGAIVAGAATVITALINRRGNKATLEELKPNSGSSMRDEVRLVLKHVVALDEKVDRHIREDHRR